MTSVSKNVYIDKLYDVVDEYNKTKIHNQNTKQLN